MSQPLKQGERKPPTGVGRQPAASAERSAPRERQLTPLEMKVKTMPKHFADMIDKKSLETEKPKFAMGSINTDALDAAMSDPHRTEILTSMIENSSQEELVAILGMFPNKSGGAAKTIATLGISSGKSSAQKALEALESGNESGAISLLKGIAGKTDGNKAKKAVAAALAQKLEHSLRARNVTSSENQEYDVYATVRTFGQETPTATSSGLDADSLYSNPQDSARKPGIQSDTRDLILATGQIIELRMIAKREGDAVTLKADIPGAEAFQGKTYSATTGEEIVQEPVAGSSDLYENPQQLGTGVDGQRHKAEFQQRLYENGIQDGPLQRFLGDNFTANPDLQVSPGTFAITVDRSNGLPIFLVNDGDGTTKSGMNRSNASLNGEALGNAIMMEMDAILEGLNPFMTESPGEPGRTYKPTSMW